MEQVKIGNKIKNLIIRLASDLPIEGMDPITPNEPYTVLHDIQASFVFEERIRTQKAQFSVLSYNNSKLGSVTLFNVPLTEKVMNLLFERDHLLSATMVEDTYADECGHIFLNRVSSKDFVYNLFLHDEDQKVTTSDIGSVDEIKRWAADENSLVIEDESLNLVSQFRCNGCEEYIDFVDTLLGFKKVDDYVFKNGMSYELRLFNSPSKMREELRKKNVNNKARMLAGYCYNWISKKDDHKGDFDINLEDNFHAQWNLNENSTIWAIKSDSFEQVGCIHTSQGIELHYVGVIIGKDLYFSNGDVKTNYEARAQTDKSLSGVKSMPLAEAARISNPLIRNTYKVLLTRAQKGTYIYCEDKKLLKHISDMTGIPIEY